MYKYKYGILIPTRNRTEQLNELLISITNLEHKPDKVVVSYSGESPFDTIRGLKEKLNIHLVENFKSGQVSQKKQGLNHFGDEVDWIMFCDDDLLLTRDCISTMFDVISKDENCSQIVGAGFSLREKVKNELSSLEKIGRFIFQLRNYPPGIVRSNGYNTSYIHENSIVYTSWLNGASIWRRDIAKSYDVPLDDVAHALSEDLIFSYRVSRKHQLLYNPNSIIYSQSNKVGMVNEAQLKYERLYHNLYFVLLNKDLSKNRYLWSTLARYLITFVRDFKVKITLKSELLNLIDVFILVLTNRSANYILENRIKNI